MTGRQLATQKAQATRQRRRSRIVGVPTPPPRPPKPRSSQQGSKAPSAGRGSPVLAEPTPSDFSNMTVEQRAEYLAKVEMDVVGGLDADTTHRVRLKAKENKQRNRRQSTLMGSTEVRPYRREDQIHLHKKAGTKRSKAVAKKLETIKEEKPAILLKKMLEIYLSEVDEDSIPTHDESGKVLTPTQKQRIRFEGLLDTLYTKAKAGDVGMMKIIMDRVMPLHKTADLSISVSAGEHISFLERMKHGDHVLRFSNEQMLDGDFTPIPRELPVEVDSAGEESEQMESPVEEAAS